MFGSVLLDVAIGMALVYLVFSTICSAINELIEGFTKNRAKDLERGIQELLNAQAGGAAVQAFYQHPLILSLFKGDYKSAAAKSWWRTGVNLPSYVPARNFALALMDLAVPGGAGTPSGATGATPAAAPANPSAVVVNVAGAAAQPLGAPIQPAPIQPGVADGAAALVGNLRTGVLNSALFDANTRRALVTLIDSADNDIVQVRQNIETWFNSAMDRVAGWYKRRTQIILFCLALILSIAINVDTVTIVNTLSTNTSVRDSLVSAAQEYARDAATHPASQTSTLLDQNVGQLKALGIPLGWTDEPLDKNPRGLPNSPSSWVLKLLGWILTACAVSLGAPFWFDLLNKFIVVRSTVKPHEKSPEEGSKQ